MGCGGIGPSAGRSYFSFIFSVIWIFLKPIIKIFQFFLLLVLYIFFFILSEYGDILLDCVIDHILQADNDNDQKLKADTTTYTTTTTVH